MRRVVVCLSMVFVLICSVACFGEPINIILGHPNPEAHSLHKGYVKFKELVEERSLGELVVEIHSGGALGGDRQLAESVNLGTIHMALNGSMSLGNYDPRFFVFDLPFIFDNYEQVDRVINGPIGKELADVVPGTSIRVLAYPENGFRNISNNRGEIDSVEGVKALKIRVMETPVHLKTFETLGAIPVTVPFPEVYGALQTKMIDAQENANSLILTSRYYEVQHFLTIPGPLFLLDMTIINNDFYMNLSPEHQKIISESAWEAAAFQRSINREENENAVKELTEKGMKVSYLTESAVLDFKEMTKSVYDSFKDRIGVSFMNKVLAELDKAPIN